MQITPLDIIIVILCIVFPPLFFVGLIIIGIVFIAGFFK